MKFEGTWGELEPKNFLQTEPYQKYLRQTVAFI